MRAYSNLAGFTKLLKYTLFCKKLRSIILYLLPRHLGPKVSGGVILAELKKIIISLPDNLLKEVDRFVSVEKTNRSEFVREAMKLYIKERRKLEMRDKMKKGYQEMAEINIKLAEICFDADNDQQIGYEDKLGEMER